LLLLLFITIFVDFVVRRANIYDFGRIVAVNVVLSFRWLCCLW